MGKYGIPVHVKIKLGDNTLNNERLLIVHLTKFLKNLLIGFKIIHSHVIFIIPCDDVLFIIYINLNNICKVNSSQRVESFRSEFTANL